MGPEGRILGCSRPVEEFDGGGSELFVELENASVARIGVDDQFGAVDAAVEIFGELMGTMLSLSPLAIRVGWVIAGRSMGVCASPVLDRLQLGPERP